jgi:hypothetical protein
MHDVPFPVRTPCDASCKKSLPDASQNRSRPPQPVEKEELKTRQIIIPHPTRCVTRAAFPSRDRQGAIVQVAS